MRRDVNMKDAKRHNNAKGQFTVEFIIATVSFIVLVVYSMDFVVKETPLFTSKHTSDEMKSLSYQISEFLIFDDGSWDTNPSDPSRLGLSGGYHAINMTKAGYLNTLCSTEAGYKKILSLLNINTHADAGSYTDFRSYLIAENRCTDVSVYNTTRLVLECPPPGSQAWECVNTRSAMTQRYQTVRYSPSTAGDVTNITVGVW